MAENTKKPAIRFAGFTEDWEQRKFEDVAVRSSTISFESGFSRVEYEDIISGTGHLNKDIFAKGNDKTGIVFCKGDVLYGKLRPYLQNLQGSDGQEGHTYDCGDPMACTHSEQRDDA